MFLGRRGVMAFYVILIVYLFGDLAIYAGARIRMASRGPMPYDSRTHAAVSVPLTLAKFTGSVSIGRMDFSDPCACASPPCTRPAAPSI
jgi:hypothetical protein